MSNSEQIPDPEDVSEVAEVLPWFEQKRQQDPFATAELLEEAVRFASNELGCSESEIRDSLDLPDSVSEAEVGPELRAVLTYMKAAKEGLIDWP